MKILFLGDIVGRPGRNLVKEVLPGVIKKKKPDLVLANAENLAGGKGINERTVKEMMDVGVDFFTGGNHIFKNPDGLSMLEEGGLPVIRPANFPDGTPGKGWDIIETKKGKHLLVINLLGQVFMNQFVDSPFRTLEAILSSVDPSQYDAALVDMHAEATSEKQALRWAFDGRVSAMIGTHTHVPTADAEISPAGTAFQADAGMNGSLDSCIGVEKEIIIKMFMTQMPVTHQLEKRGRMQFNAVVLDIGADAKAKKISHLREIL